MLGQSFYEVFLLDELLLDELLPEIRFELDLDVKERGCARSEVVG